MFARLILYWPLFLPMDGHAACRQALALGLDVSGSVDANEYRLQTNGLASALLHHDVQDALFAFPGAPIRLFVYEWAGQNSQRVLIPWVDVTDQAHLNDIAERLRKTIRVEHDPATAIGEAIQFGLNALTKNPKCWRRTLDVSGDGDSNTGIRPRDLKARTSYGDVTINGLVIGDAEADTSTQQHGEIGQLWAYYKTEVIHGPNAFVEVALGFTDFEAAMARKLLREIERECPIFCV